MTWTTQHTVDTINLLTNDQLLLAWQTADKALEVAKAQENLLRRSVVARYLTQPNEGMNNVELGKGYLLKIQQPFNYTLSNSEKPKSGEPLATDKALDAIKALGNEGKFIADRLVKWKPELSITEYRNLAPQYKAVIDKALTITPGLPTIEIKAPAGV